MDSKEQKYEEFRKWIMDNGCKMHPGIKILEKYDGVMGIGTCEDLPHKTLILAVPSKLILSIKRCYNDPELKSLFEENDDLFDYEADEEG